MNESEIACTALISTQRGLLGVITPNIRQISMEWDGVEVVRFRVYYESQPTEDELEGIEDMATEVMCCGIFNWQEPVEILVSNAPKTELKCLDRLVYQRKEL